MQHKSSPKNGFEKKPGFLGCLHSHLAADDAFGASGEPRV